MKNFLMVAAITTFGLGAMGAMAFSGEPVSQPSRRTVSAIDVDEAKVVDARLHAVLKTLIAQQSR